MAAKVKWDPEAWDAIVKEVVSTKGVEAMTRVADASNASAGIDDGYRVSVDGGKPLEKHDYRATVITATGEAMRDNAKNNTLVNNFHLAGD